MTFIRFQVGETDIILLMDEFQKVYDNNRNPIWCKTHKDIQLRAIGQFDNVNCPVCANIGRDPPYLGDYKIR